MLLTIEDELWLAMELCAYGTASKLVRHGTVALSPSPSLALIGTVACRRVTVSPG